jgi:hypothetical protein
MKFKIDSKGFLKIQRGTNFKKVACPLTINGWCGDWCALFGEPETMLDHEAKPYISLELCKKTLITKAEDFKDER